MKRTLIFILTVVLTLTSWMGTKAEAQNAVFEKYAEMDNIEYVCITSAMLKNLGKNSATINGIRIDGITNALKNVLIVNSSNEEVVKTMKEDFATIRKEEGYEMMMDMRDGSDRIVTLAKIDPAKGSEIIVYITEGNNETSFVVLNGKFTEEQLNKLLAGNMGTSVK